MTARFKDLLPGELVHHVSTICGAKGEVWLETLPAIIAELESQWGISVGEPFPGIEFNFVADAVQEDGFPAAVKIAPPFETPEIFSEAKYLRLHDGEGAVKLLAEDRGRKALLLERAIPGDPLHRIFESDPAACIAPAIELLKTILRPAPVDMKDVPSLDEWFEKFTAFRTTDFPADFGERALRLYNRLRSVNEKTFYIHGDYHPGNIVSATREEFQVIDPKGIVGGVGYDIAVFLINLERWQRGKLDYDCLLSDAISAFALAFGFSDREIREWVFVHMVIGAWWNFEDMPDHFDAELAMPAYWHL